MLNKIIADYINKKREIKGWTIADLITHSQSSEGTVKKICIGKADNPTLETMIPIMDAVDGSFDEMLHPDKYETKVSDDAIVALMSAIRETNGEHIRDIREHYMQHREDVTKNFELRLADKQEIINTVTQEKIKLELQLEKKEKDTKKGNLIRNIFIIILGGCLIALLVAELLHPEHGWLTFRTLK